MTPPKSIPPSAPCGRTSHQARSTHPPYGDFKSPSRKTPPRRSIPSAPPRNTAAQPSANCTHTGSRSSENLPVCPWPAPARASPCHQERNGRCHLHTPAAFVLSKTWQGIAQARAYVGANGIDLSVLHASSYLFCFLKAPTVLRMIAWGN